MDADIFRLVLFLAGVGLILGIYLWDRYKKINARVHAIRKARQETVPELLSAADRGVVDPQRAIEDRPLKPAASERLGFTAIPATPDDPVLADVDPEQEETRDDMLAGDVPIRITPALNERVEFSFTADKNEPSAEEGQLEGVPSLILQINVVATDTLFSGEDIFNVAKEMELIHGDTHIFHRYTGDKTPGAVIFSMASMVNPGVFIPEQMADFTTPGLTLFGQLPGPKDGLAAFSDMLFTAERLAAMLSGELQDENHSVLSKQTIEHIRSRILEHRRQVQLALSKR